MEDLRQSSFRQLWCWVWAAPNAGHCTKPSRLPDVVLNLGFSLFPDPTTCNYGDSYVWPHFWPILTGHLTAYGLDQNLGRHDSEPRPLCQSLWGELLPVRFPSLHSKRSSCSKHTCCLADRNIWLVLHSEQGIALSCHQRRWSYVWRWGFECWLFLCFYRPDIKQTTQLL